jgi:hypothetical protein
LLDGKKYLKPLLPSSHVTNSQEVVRGCQLVFILQMVLPTGEEATIEHRNKYMERKFHREKKTIELIETLVECIEFWSKLCANGKFFYCGISLPYIYFYAIENKRQYEI